MWTLRCKASIIRKALRKSTPFFCSACKLIFSFPPLLRTRILQEGIVFIQSREGHHWIKIEPPFTWCGHCDLWFSSFALSVSNRWSHAFGTRLPLFQPKALGFGFPCQLSFPLYPIRCGTCRSSSPDSNVSSLHASIRWTVYLPTVSPAITNSMSNKGISKRTPSNLVPETNNVHASCAVGDIEDMFVWGFFVSMHLLCESKSVAHCLRVTLIPTVIF